MVSDKFKNDTMVLKEVLLLFIGIFLIKDCLGRTTPRSCIRYNESSIKSHCVEFKVENGHVCFTSLNPDTPWTYWRANISCNTGYALTTGYSTEIPQCYKAYLSGKYNYRWSNTPADYKCLSDGTNKGSSSNGDEKKDESDTIRTHTTNNPNVVKTTTNILNTDEHTTNKHDVIEDATNTLDHDDEDPPVIYIAVSLVVVLCISIVVFLIWMFVFRRNYNICLKAPRENQTNQQINGCDDEDIGGRDSVLYNTIQGEACGDFVYIEHDYQCIEEARVSVDTAPAIVDDNSEYNTLHDHLNQRPKDQNALTTQADVYAHATAYTNDIKPDTDTYSHINETKQQNKRLRFYYDDGNVYNKLAVGGESTLKELGKSEESLYNHTTTGPVPSAPAFSETDTYAHVNKDPVPDEK